MRVAPFELGGDAAGGVRKFDRDTGDLELLVIEEDNAFMLGEGAGIGREIERGIHSGRVATSRQPSQTKMHARTTIARKVTASFSYLVATRRYRLIFAKNCSTT